jgi:hypothetical protein
MSYGDLIVLEPGQPENVMFWTDVEGEREPACAILELIIPIPIFRSVLTYEGEQRTVYMTRDWSQSEEFPLNPAATELVGCPVYGPFVINIVRGFF